MVSSNLFLHTALDDETLTWLLISDADSLKSIATTWQLCDRADRYATKLYNPEFLHAKGLPVPPWLENETDRESARRHEAFDKALHSALRTGQISKQMSFG